MKEPLWLSALYTTSCTNLSQLSYQLFLQVQKGIEAGRRQLAQAFVEHKTVCEAFDATIGERPRGRFGRGPDQDPWATEGRLVQEHKALRSWQVRIG